MSLIHRALKEIEGEAVRGDGPPPGPAIGRAPERSWPRWLAGLSFVALLGAVGPILGMRYLVPETEGGMESSPAPPAGDAVEPGAASLIAGPTQAAYTDTALVRTAMAGTGSPSADVGEGAERTPSSAGLPVAVGARPAAESAARGPGAAETAAADAPSPGTTPRRGTAAGDPAAAPAPDNALAQRQPATTEPAASGAAASGTAATADSPAGEGNDDGGAVTARTAPADATDTVTTPAPEPAGRDNRGGAPQGGGVRRGLPEATLAEARSLHGRLLRQVAAEDWPAAEDTLSAAGRVLPEDHLLRLRMAGWYAFKRGRHSRAVQHYQRILERFPGDEEAGLNLAYIHIREGRREAAREVLQRARRHAPDSEALQQAARQLED